MHFHIVTLFPESFSSYLGTSILSRALEKKKIKVFYYNPRDFTADKHRRVDHRPYGGGPGMVLEAEAVIKAIAKAKGRRKKVKIIFFSPTGGLFTNTYAENLVKKYTHVIFVCGRYEGVDARVKKVFPMDDISIGPYILTGGELAALVIMDTTTRRIPGVIGTYESLEEERIASSDVYTRPEILFYKGKKYKVPKVLLSGHHKNIDVWRAKREK
ncbi:MAG: tRNA (guanine37-N1)-methyltransferase [Parcubacteria group bacterium Gr01-1014_48]|nr:MAG: tRNA (guanine37-N1)-methyltransferase [Parcubacteria group bacterium Greene0416_14]TSC74242.1 MAG: tRNA (guanine37-N1)-methyltransferase [Parcubacteria group bacterium Gr01-1014_48]TSD01517.1 MAG: tRNA (guanine37-N1)-methyltransferase [Parcubacteria group bacterium Greene1014_15]